MDYLASANTEIKRMMDEGRRIKWKTEHGK
jgi:hypothetical protein